MNYIDIYILVTFYDPTLTLTLISISVLVMRSMNCIPVRGVWVLSVGMQDFEWKVWREK